MNMATQQGLDKLDSFVRFLQIPDFVSFYLLCVVALFLYPHLQVVNCGIKIKLRLD